MWSFGVLLAGIVFKKQPFFHGHDNFDQLMKIVRVLGSDNFSRYIQRYSIEMDSQSEGLIGVFNAKPLKKYVKAENQDIASGEVLDLLQQILVYDHVDRITASEALQHPYFEPVVSMYNRLPLPGKRGIKRDSPEGPTGSILKKNMHKK